MSIQRNHLNYLYIATGLTAWILTSLHLTEYLSDGFVQGTIHFWKDALFEANSAARFLTVDILFLAFAVISWMLIEARQRGIDYVWVYVLIGLFIGISLAVPLFLAARERCILRQTPADHAIELSHMDLIGLFALAVVTLAGAGLTLM